MFDLHDTPLFWWMQREDNALPKAILRMKWVDIRKMFKSVPGKWWALQYQLLSFLRHWEVKWFNQGHSAKRYWHGRCSYWVSWLFIHDEAILLSPSLPPFLFAFDLSLMSSEFPHLEEELTLYCWPLSAFGLPLFHGGAVWGLEMTTCWGPHCGLASNKANTCQGKQGEDPHLDLLTSGYAILNRFWNCSEPQFHLQKRKKNTYHNWLVLFWFLRVKWEKRHKSHAQCLALINVKYMLVLALPQI